MQEHIVDIILAAIIVLTTIRYYCQGLVQTVFKFGSFIVALLSARIFCGTVTDWIYSNTKLFGSTERYLAKLIVFVLIYIVVRLLFTWIIHLLDSLKKLPILKKTNKFLGALLGFGCGLMAVIVLSVGLQISSHVVYNAKYVNAIDSSVIVQAVISNDKIAENIGTRFRTGFPLQESSWFPSLHIFSSMIQFRIISYGRYLFSLFRDFRIALTARLHAALIRSATLARCLTRWRIS